jgi:hypothetical protein
VPQQPLHGWRPRPKHTLRRPRGAAMTNHRKEERRGHQGTLGDTPQGGPSAQVSLTTSQAELPSPCSGGRPTTAAACSGTSHLGGPTPPSVAPSGHRAGSATHNTTATPAKQTHAHWEEPPQQPGQHSRAFPRCVLAPGVAMEQLPAAAARRSSQSKRCPAVAQASKGGPDRRGQSWYSR